MEARIKVSKYFFLDEFVDPQTYLTKDDNGLSLIDSKLFAIADLLREKLGKPLRINNWYHYYVQLKAKGWSDDKVIKTILNSDYSKWSGYRSNLCKIGAKASAHRKGEAIDPKGDEDTMFEIVKSNAKEFYQLGLRRLEDPSITKGCLHVDTMERNTTPNTIRVVDLKKVTEIIKL